MYISGTTSKKYFINQSWSGLHFQFACLVPVLCFLLFLHYIWFVKWWTASFLAGYAGGAGTAKRPDGNVPHSALCSAFQLVTQCAHLYTTIMCFTLILWSAFQYLCFHRLVLHLTSAFPSVNWTNYPPPTSQAHSWWDLKYYDVRLVRPKIDTWISPSWVC